MFKINKKIEVQNHIMKKLPSIKEIRRAIPDHCFERSFLKSTAFLGRDLLLCISLGTLAWNYLEYELTVINSFTWIIYGIIQGTFMLGIWYIAHECAHHAYCEYDIINDFIGFILYSLLLVPYFSWQYTHDIHHIRTNHLLDNETNVPVIKRKIEKIFGVIIDSIGENLFAILYIFNMLFLAWYEYIFFHITGSKRSFHTKKKFTSFPNFFDPRSKNELFPTKISHKIFISTSGIIIVLSILLFIGFKIGFFQLFVLYFIPFIVVKAWVITYAWIAHTDPTVPHYGETNWTWINGAISTIDRKGIPWIINELHHHAGPRHVYHHLFPMIPHYHSKEATEHIKRVLGKYYREDDTPLFKVLWNLAKTCHYVEDVTGIQYYQSAFTHTKIT